MRFGYASEQEFNDYCRRNAVACACQAIARAPWLELRATTKGWDIYWAAEGNEPAVPHETGQNLDWKGLCDFAHSLISEINAK